MKKFFIRALAFSLAAIILLLACEAYYYYSGMFESKVDGWEVYAAKRQSKTKQHKKKLVLGDSVAMQLFPCDADNDSIASLACNQAISLAGYYFLLQNYIETNREDLPVEVILLINPLTLSNDLDRFAFHYFLKPFYTKEYLPEYSDSLSKRCHQIPFYWLSMMPFVRSSSYTFHYDLPEEDYAWLSPISQDYLPQMIQICEAHNMRFRMVPVPIDEVKRKVVETKVAAEPSLNTVLTDFTSRFQYYSDDCFRDKTHLTPAALQSIDKSQFLIP